jgi:hypothetical protein
MKRFKLAAGAKDARENERIILAHGEVTGHAHEVVKDDADLEQIPPAQFFEEPDGRRVLLVDRPCQLVHQEHGAIAIDPEVPQQIRQGDVFLNPIGKGAWEIVRQREYSPEAIRQVAD